MLCYKKHYHEDKCVLENPRSGGVNVPTEPTRYRMVVICATTFVWCRFVKSIAIDPIVATGLSMQQRVFTLMGFRTFD